MTLSLRALAWLCLSWMLIVGAWAQTPTKLEPFDGVRIVCPSRPFLDAEVALNSMGVAWLPLGKSIVLAGLDLREAESRVRRLYESELAVSLPSLSLVWSVNRHAPVRYSGEVAVRGLTFASKGLKLSDVLALARPTEMADLEALEVHSGGAVRILRLTRNTAEWDIELRPGDKVVVPRLGRVRQVFVLGSVVRPGAIDLVPGLTAKRAVELAGGASPQGDLGAVEVKRDGKSLGLIDFEFNDVPLQAGDTVAVPLRSNAAYVLVVGRVARPGRRPMREGLTLREAILEAGLDEKIRQGQVRLVRLENGRSTSKTYELAAVLEGREPPVRLVANDRIELPETPG